MTKSRLLLALTVLGCLVPFGVIAYIVITTGTFNFARLLTDSFATPYATFVSLDLLVTGIAFLTIYFSDWSRGHLAKLPWLPLVLTFSLGICAGLPCYLYLKSLKHVPAT